MSITTTEMRILRAIQPRGEVCGKELYKCGVVARGTVYVMFQRMEQKQLITRGRTEVGSSFITKYWRLTEYGERVAIALELAP